jgi:hypothetical protein
LRRHLSTDFSKGAEKAKQNDFAFNVRVGLSKTVLVAPKRHFRSTPPINGHYQTGQLVRLVPKAEVSKFTRCALATLRNRRQYIAVED